MSCLREFCITSLHRLFLLVIPWHRLDDDAQEELHANIGLPRSVGDTLNAMDNALVLAVELLISIASIQPPVADITLENAQLLSPQITVQQPRLFSLLMTSQSR